MMNRAAINAFRASQGLAPFVTTDAEAQAAKARKQRQAANAAAHAQLQRDLKSKRSKGGK